MKQIPIVKIFATEERFQQLKDIDKYFERMVKNDTYLTFCIMKTVTAANKPKIRQSISIYGSRSRYVIAEKVLTKEYIEKLTEVVPELKDYFTQ